MNHPPIDAERLAALLDGRTDSARRAAILAEVAESEDAAAVLADAAAVLRELEASDAAVSELDAGEEDAGAPHLRSSGTGPAGPDTPGAPIPEANVTNIEARRATSAAEPTHGRSARRSWLRGSHLPWLAAAAALVIVLTPLLRSRPTDAEVGPAAAFAIPLTSESRREANAVRPQEWSTTRSGEIVLSPNARAARLGVRLADLELAAERGDTAASRFAREIAVLMADIGGGAPTVAYYQMVANSVSDSRTDPYTLLRRGSDSALAAVGPDSVSALRTDRRALLRRGRDAVFTAVGPDADDVLALAAWAELGRAAASAGDTGFLRDRRGLALLKRGQAALANDEAALEAVQRLHSQLSSESPSDGATLRIAFEELLRELTH